MTMARFLWLVAAAVIVVVGWGLVVGPGGEGGVHSWGRDDVVGTEEQAETNKSAPAFL